MISVASTIKNHLAHAFFFCALGDQFADFTRERNLAVIRNGSQRLYRRLLLALLCLWQDSFRLLGRSAALTLSALLLLLTFSGRFSSLLGLRAPAFTGGGQNLGCQLSRSYNRFCRALSRVSYGPHSRVRHLRLKIAQRLIQRRGSDKGRSRRIINNLCVDMLATAEDVQARTHLSTFQVASNSLVPPQPCLIRMKLFNHCSSFLHQACQET